MEKQGPMATAMIYDTLKLAEQLEHEAGFDAPRAKAMARIFAENASGNLVTREDLLALREDLLEKIGGVDVRIGGLEGRIGGLEGRVGGLEGKVIVLYWVTGTTLAGVATLMGIAIAIALHLMHLE
jgi:hypothetical protein